MDPTVVTIYCCGTAFHRDRIDFSVPYTWRATKGDRVWINDGPGNTTHPILKAEKILKKVESTGPQAPNSDQSLMERIKTTVPNKWHNRMYSTHHTTSVKQLTGTGSQDNIVITLQWLWMEYFRKDKPKFKTINLVGWSRGAVTCIMLAHAIEAAGFRGLIPTLKVNIFAFDPVPGGLNDFQNEGTFLSTGRVGTPDTLSPCVNEYVAVLAENPDWKHHVFKNVSPSTTGSTTKKEYPMPADHSGVANHLDNNPVGRIGISLCHEFLEKHGTQLYMDKQLGEKKMLELYAEALLKTGKYKTKGWFRRKKVFVKAKTTSTRKPLVRNDLREHDFFINQHHVDLLAKYLPKVFTSMATGMPIDQGEQTKLMGAYGKTWDALRATGYIS